MTVEEIGMALRVMAANEPPPAGGELFVEDGRCCWLEPDADIVVFAIRDSNRNPGHRPAEYTWLDCDVTIAQAIEVWRLACARWVEESAR